MGGFATRRFCWMIAGAINAKADKNIATSRGDEEHAEVVVNGKVVFAIRELEGGGCVTELRWGDKVLDKDEMDFFPTSVTGIRQISDYIGSGKADKKFMEVMGFEE